MKKKLSTILTSTIASFVLASSVVAATPQEKSIEVDGKSLTTKVIIQNDHQMVPAHFFKHIQADVQWNEAFHAAVIHHPNGTIGFPSGKRYADYLHTRSSEDQWKRDYLNTTVTDLKDGTYIPLAYTVRKLGMEVQYDAVTKKTWIATEPQHFAVRKAEPDMVASATDEDLQWLYKMTEAEAGGESYDGKVAVAASILNRVKSDDWPDTIKDTLFQVTYFNGKSYYQYSPVLDKRLYNANPSDETIRAVDAALRGEDPSLGATVFYNPAKTSNQWVRDQPTTVVIGNHVFAKNK